MVHLALAGPLSCCQVPACSFGGVRELKIALLAPIPGTVDARDFNAGAKWKHEATGEDQIGKTEGHAGRRRQE